MKIKKYALSLSLLVLAIFACTSDDDNTDYVNNIAAPTNVSATVRVTQDNTGLVTITPLGEGVSNFNITFGDGSDTSGNIQPGASIEHVYEEGTYEATIKANGLNGLSTIVTQPIVVSFQAPQNLEVTIENDLAVSKKVNVTATAEFAMYFAVYFGEDPNETPVEANIGDTASYIYQEPGQYTIRVVAMGAAIETTEYIEENFEVTAIVQPLASAPTPPARAAEDVISIFSSAYDNVPDTNYFPDWGQGGQGSGWAMFDLNGDEMLQYINLSYQGIALADGTSINVSAMEYLHLDVWTADVVTDIETSLINGPSGTTEAPVTTSLNADDWTSIEIPISAYTDQGLTVNEIFQLKFVGTPWAAGTVFIDNIYFYKEPSTAPSIVGTWKIANEAGALGVGPAPGDTSWWNCDAACVTDRACYYDDTYVFGADGSFTNVLGSDTWIEGWQGGGDACGTPVAPYDGTAAATYDFNESAGTLTINGTGGYIGLPKANNQGELPNVAVPSSITYNVTLVDANTMNVVIEAGAGVFWQYKLVREGGAPSPLEGTWQIANEAGALGVGPAPGDTSWWNCDAACVSDRACYYDDSYVFGADGSFTNVLGSETWVEGWQGGGDACGTPVAPYDGNAVATYSYNASAGTITLNGTGAFIGLPKANNQGELPNVAVPTSITYNVTFIDSNTINVVIEAGAGVFWQYKLVKN
jgi:hypothetical protein